VIKMVGLTLKQKEFRQKLSQLPQEIRFNCGCQAVKIKTGYNLIEFCQEHNPFKELKSD